MDAAAGSPSSPLRIVLCPWLAFGHLLPYLELAERLALRGHRVSFVSTPGNLARLPPPRSAAAPRVDLVALPLPRVEGLPDGAESTNSVSGETFELLWKAFDGLGAPFAEFLRAACAVEGTRPDWVIADTFNHWAAAVAVEHNVPCAMLLPTAAMIAGWTVRSSIAGSVFDEWADVDERPPAVPRYEWEGKSKLYVKHSASGMSIVQRASLTLQSCTITAIRSCAEWEGEVLPLLPALLGKPGKKVGLLVPRDENDGSFDREGVARAVRAVMLEEDTRSVFVANALEMQKVVADEKLQEKYIDEFVQHLRSRAGDGHSAPCC
ncbi:hypothetical protein EJB05_05538, partial [Eragrostis curvula]